ncbi:MAG TPA: tetratricopeptide repeat protein [Kofleriaceae bacterium]|nr:tetratricopeptide repeat protein [Kofleriaceae bacterium]
MSAARTYPARCTCVALVLAFAVLAVVGCAHRGPVGPPPPLPREVYAHYLDGKLAGYRGDWEGAADALAQAAAAAPDQPMVAVELARAQMKAKRTAAAIVTLAAAREKWPGHPQVWLVSGDLLAASDAPEAIRAYLRAIQLSPDDERAYLGLAKLQKDDAAESTLRILITHVPASVDGHYRLAVRLAMRGELEPSTKELRAVLERDPDHIDARLDLARALRRLGHLDQAIVETRSAFDRSGQALDIAEELFWLLCESDDRTAATDLLTLLDDDRSDADALAVVARLDRGLGRLAEAREVASRIAAIDREAGAIGLAEIQLAASDRSAAIATLSAIGGDSRLAPVAHRLRAEAALAAGDPAAALAAIAPLLDAHVGAPSRHNPADAPKLADASKPADGRADSEAADANDDAEGNKSGDAKSAADRKRPGASPRTRSLDGALIAAFALADLGRLGEARAALAPFQAAAEPADRQAATLARARLADHVGDAAGALGLLEPLIRERPDLVTALNLAGYLLADSRQRLDDAERYLRHARELAPGDPAILDSWGWLLLRRGKARDAVRALDRAARFAPLEPEILVHLAQAWAADGAPRTAAETLDRAAALAPSAALQKRIAAVRHSLPAR